MLNFTIKITDHHLDSLNVSIQADHIAAFIYGKLSSISVTDWNDNHIKTYRGRELAKLLASAVERGPLYSGSDMYFLGKR